MGGALLAKATDDRVDSLSQDERAGPGGYSLRRTAEYLAGHNDGRFHLGTSSQWPLNNRPFLGGPSRVDEFTKISAHARPAFDLFRDCLTALNRLDRARALEALAAFLQVRMAVADRERTASEEAVRGLAILPADALLGVCERFIFDDPEGGRRAQAFAAAVFDCVFNDVRLQPINNPNPGDVRVIRNGKVVPVEIKQVAVNEDRAMELAREATALGGDAAILLVLAEKHEPLDRERIRRHAIRVSGVAVEVCESVREFIGVVAAFSCGSIQPIVDSLPRTFAARLREHEVSERGQRRWRELIEARLNSG